jgi:hypothetical protein
MIDWDRHAGRYYVIVDPIDPDGLLYLSEKEYNVERRIAISNETAIEVLARPSSKRSENEQKSKTEASKTSPPSRVSSLSLLTVKGPLSRVFPSYAEDGAVSLTSRNTRDFFTLWGKTLLFYSGAPWRKVRNPRIKVRKYCYSMLSFARKCEALQKNNGNLYLVKYLKVTLVIVLQYLTSHPCADASILGVRMRLTRGLPS